MKKLRLDLDDLEVESFDTTPAGEEANEGTVFGYSCPSCPSCGLDLNETCGSCPGMSCQMTCGGATCAPCTQFC
ncbi:MAG: hypothetical protein AAF657_16055 [Acidobacteriota bacterium]